MHVRRAVEQDRRHLAELAARLQGRPDRHVAYLGTDAESIRDEMIAEDEDWTAVSAVAERANEVVGWSMGSVDEDMGRVWWFGPFVDTDDDEWESVASALHESASRSLPSAVTEQEYAPDACFELLIEWALARGFHRDPRSAALALDGPLGPPTIRFRSVTSADVDTVGRLHDDLFPDTHTTGASLVTGADEDRLRFVLERDGTVLGYVAVERQPDGTGYIDYLGVAPDHRRRGLGAELIRAGVAELRAIGCDRCHLAVREDNAGARALYTSLGFVEERVIAPMRQGFSIP
jgi:ribosomal protein S18 acetylase RimI-like enzyme